MLAWRRRLLALGTSMGLMSAVFQPTGCSVNVDQATLDQLMSWLENSDFNANFHFNSNGGGHGHDDGDDDVDDDGGEDNDNEGGEL